MLRIGSALSAIIHGTLLAVILLGWPVLDFLWEREWPWLEPERYRRVDVVIFSDKEDPSVVFGEGAISLDSEVFGQGNAQERGRAPGTHATMALRGVPQPNGTIPSQGSPNRPGAEAPSPQPQISAELPPPPSIPTAEAPPQPEMRDLAHQAEQGAEDSGREGQAEQSPPTPEMLGQQPTAEANEAPGGEPATGEDRAAAAETEIATAAETARMESAAAVTDELPAPESPAGAEGPEPVMPLSRLHPLMDLQTASLAHPALERLRAARQAYAGTNGAAGQDTAAEAQAPVQGMQEQTVEAAEATEATARETGTAAPGTLAQASQPIAEDGDERERTPATVDASAEEARTAEAPGTGTSAEEARTAEAPSTGTASEEETQSAEAPGAATSAEEETREASAERPAELTGGGEGVVIEIAPGTFGEAYLPTAISDSEAAVTESADAEATTTAAESERPSADENTRQQAAEEARDEDEMTAAVEAAEAAEAAVEAAEAATATRQDVQEAPSAESQLILASSLASISPAAGTAQLSQVPSTAVGMKLLLRTMPGLGEDLSEAIAHPEAPLELPPTERRQRVLERMEAAAERGYAHAQFGIARRYLIGHGTPRDPVKAGEWLMQAAQQGHARAQLALGYLAARGHGVERDLSESMLWWTLAAEAGNEAAARAAAMLEPHLSPEELIRARREVTSWRASLGTAIPIPSPGGNEVPKLDPLQEAVATGDLAAVHSLLARGEDADGLDIDGRTALINAGWRGDKRIASTLLEVGADPDLVDEEGKTALIWAASNGHMKVVEQLAAAGTELDIQDDKGLTALMRATWNGYTDVVEALVEVGADRGLRDQANMSALDYAKRQGYDDIVAMLEGGS